MQTNAKPVIAQHRAREQPLIVMVPPIDPAVYNERMEIHGDDPSRQFREARCKQLNQLYQAVTATRKNPTLNAAEIEIKVAEMVRKHADDAYVLFDVQRQALVRRQAGIQAEVVAACQPQTARDAALAQELRTFLRSLPETERYRVINDAVGTDDHLTYLYAVTSAPAALSGVAAGKHLEMKNVALALKDVALLHRPAEIARELALNDKAETGFRSSISELVDFDKADALKQLAGDAQ